MNFVLAASDSAPITDIFRWILLYAIWAELVGVPMAWLQVRKVEAWQERPEEIGRVRLLSMYIAKVTALIVIWGALVGFSVFVGSRT